MRYSVIVPVYNRPEEVKELLESLCAQTFTDFEVILVEDGSSIPCKSVAREYSNRLSPALDKAVTMALTVLPANT